MQRYGTLGRGFKSTRRSASLAPEKLLIRPNLPVFASRIFRMLIIIVESHFITREFRETHTDRSTDSFLQCGGNYHIVGRSDLISKLDGGRRG